MPVNKHRSGQSLHLFARRDEDELRINSLRFKVIETFDQLSGLNKNPQLPYLLKLGNYCTVMEKKHMSATNNLAHRRQCPATYQLNSDDHLVPELCRDPPQPPHCADLVLGSHLVHHSLANQERRPQHPILHLGRMLRHSLRQSTLVTKHLSSLLPSDVST